MIKIWSIVRSRKLSATQETIRLWQIIGRATDQSTYLEREQTASERREYDRKALSLLAPLVLEKSPNSLGSIKCRDRTLPTAANPTPRPAMSTG
jgi:hypothetical protein